MTRPGVLLVDDRPENLLTLQAVLEPLPCRQVAVGSGEEALKALLQDEFAVVLLDVQMPGMNGFETAEVIKGRERTRTLPIIFLTAISKERHHVFRGYSAGAVDYVLKPYDPSVLRSKVAVFLELDRNARAAAHSEALLRAAFDAAPIGMARLELDGRVAEVNPALARLVGQPPGDLCDRLLETLVRPRDQAAVARLRRIAAEGNGTPDGQRDVKLLTAGGASVACTMRVSLARAVRGAASNLIVQVVDMRERERAETERAERQREHAARRAAERAAERLRVVQRISDAALGTLSFDGLVRALLDRTIDALGVDRAAISLADDAEMVVHQAARDNGATAFTERRVPRPGGGLTAPPPGVLGPSVTASMATELVVDGAPIGALFAGTVGERQFTPDDAALFDLAADRAAIGIERVRVYAHEHRIAQELQRSLLPSALPVVEGLSIAARYAPAGAGAQVGGDWYDAVVDPEGRLLLLIGDVAGRGIVAAAAMGQLRSAARAYALDGQEPGALLARLNAFQIGLSSTGMTTMALVRVDPRSGEVRYAKAGHPPPLLVARDGTTTWLDQGQGPPLGALDEPRYVETSTRLDPGGVLLLYTDGLVEVRGELLDQGFERLRTAAARPDTPADALALCDAVLARTLRDPAVDDDVTLLAVRADGPGPVVAHLELPADARASAVARRAVDEALGEVVSAGQLDDLRILVTEVVGNAVVHGDLDAPDAHVVLGVAATPEVVRVEITNTGRPFEPKEPSPRDEPGGFGLVVVDKLSSRWGVEPGDGGGVCVWFEMQRA